MRWTCRTIASMHGKSKWVAAVLTGGWVSHESLGGPPTFFSTGNWELGVDLI